MEMWKRSGERIQRCQQRTAIIRTVAGASIELREAQDADGGERLAGCEGGKEAEDNCELSGSDVVPLTSDSECSSANRAMLGQRWLRLGGLTLSSSRVRWSYWKVKVVSAGKSWLR